VTDHELRQRWAWIARELALLREQMRALEGRPA
jgi:hypothetical protein